MKLLDLFKKIKKPEPDLNEKIGMVRRDAILRALKDGKMK